MIGLEIYAKALFQASQDPYEMYQTIKQFNILYYQDKQIFEKINGNIKAYELFKDLIFESFGLEFANFIGVLIEDGRMNEWNRFLDHFRDLCVNQDLIYDVNVVSAKPLTESFKSKLEVQIQSKIKKPCEFRYGERASLIQGFQITINHQRIDMSIKGTLDKLKKEVLQ